LPLTPLQLRRRAGLAKTEAPAAPRDRTTLPCLRWAWVYKRLSTHEQRKKSIWGLAMQDELERIPVEDGYPVDFSMDEAAAIRSSAAYPGWYANGHIHVEERDLGISGTKNHHHRPGLAALIQAIERDEVEAIYVLDIKRLYRDQYLIDAMTFAKLCRDHGVLIVTPVLTYDLTQEIYSEMYEIEVKNAARELKVLRFRLGGAKELKAKKGFWDGRPIPWGYIVDLDPQSPTYQKLILYPTHQRVLVELFQLSVQYQRYRALEKAVQRQGLCFAPFPIELREQQFKLHAMRNCKLNEDGSYTPSIHALDSILTNPTCLGWWPVGDLLLKNNHEAAVPEELFWQAQEIFNPIDFRTGEANPAYRGQQRGTRIEPTSTLTGKLYCGMHPEDGERSAHRVAAKGHYQRKGYTTHYYGCTSDYENCLSPQKCLLVTQDVIDQAVIKHVLRCLQDYDLAVEIAAEVDTGFAREAQVKRQSDRDVRSLKAEMTRLKAKLPWAKTRRDYDLLMAEINARQERIDALGSQQKPRAGRSLKPSQIEDVRAFLQMLPQHWDRVSIEAKARFLDIVLERVTVFHDDTMRLELHVEWRTGVLDIVESLRPLPSRPPGWRWEDWEDDALRRLYSTERDPAAILAELKPVRNWASAMERAWKLGLSRAKDLTPFGTGRAAIAPIGMRPAMNPTGLNRGEYRYVGTVWETAYVAPDGAAAGTSATRLIEVSPALRLLRDGSIRSFSSGFSEVSLLERLLRILEARPETARRGAPG